MDHPQTKTDAVRNLQRYLRRLSFDDPTLMRVPVDGIFERQTEDAVKAFQVAYGLPETGRVDRRTWDRIYDAYLRAERATDRTPITNFFPAYPEGYELAYGEHSLTVSLLQLLLQELTVIYDSISIGEISARLGFCDQFYFARKFRRIHGETPGSFRRKQKNVF